MKRFLIFSGLSALLITVTYFLPYGFWASIGDLPAHPLIVHGVVVLLPLIALVILIGVFRNSIFSRYEIPLLILIVIANIGVLAAKSSGDSLAAAVGLPKDHAEWGNNLVPVAMVLFALFVLLRISIYVRRVAILRYPLVGFLAIASVITIGVTWYVGHSGAESVWKYKYENAQSPISEEKIVISASEVSSHNKPEDCWTIVDGKVYDVTSFVNKHPAGSPAIVEMCGKNSSEEFLGEHSGQAEPEKWLSRLQIGVIG